MNRSKLNSLFDLAIFLPFMIVAITGLYMYFFIPLGVPKGRYQVYLGLTKATWTMIHNKVSIYTANCCSGTYFASLQMAVIHDTQSPGKL